MRSEGDIFKPDKSSSGTSPASSLKPTRLESGARRQSVAAASGARAAETPHVRLKHVTNWEDLAHRSGYSPAKLARLTGCSVRHLERFWMSTWSSSPKKWLTELQMRRALNLLKDGFAVKHVAADVGFQSASHFSRAFRKRFGICPRDIYAYSAEIPAEMSQMLK